MRKSFLINFYIVCLLLLSQTNLFANRDSLVYYKAVNSVGLITDNTSSVSSCFFINNDIVVTNWHVTETLHLPSARITMKNGDEYRIDKILLEDKISDLAVVKIRGNNRNFLTLADHGDITTEMDVYSLGNPTNESFEVFKFRMTKGKIKSIKEEDWFYDDDSEHLAYSIRHTATIKPGNSGGPLLDKEGNVVGVNTYFYSYSRNYAVHVEELITLLDNEMITYSRLNPDGTMNTKFAKKVSEKNKFTYWTIDDLWSIGMLVLVLYGGTMIVIMFSVTMFAIIFKKSDDRFKHY